ncbi:MAG: SDR family NAD(P)-dependent oxidoreductase [Peptococcaceae bacterium]
MLTNKVALVTGGSAGIGKEIVLRYLQEGATVITIARNIDKLKKIRNLTDRNDQLFLQSCDMGSREDVQMILNYIKEKFGRLDILVNNAGIMDGMEPIGDVSDETWDKVIAVNLTGPFLLCRGVVKMMLEQEEKGIIINVASGGGIGGGRAGTAYTASKFGLVGMSRNIAYMYAPQGIRCNVICPGAVKTEITMPGLNQEGWARVSDGVKNIRMGDAKEIADLALYLASPYATLINGAIIPADAGKSAW